MARYAFLILFTYCAVAFAETDAEKIARLEKENAALKAKDAEKGKTAPEEAPKQPASREEAAKMVAVRLYEQLDKAWKKEDWNKAISTLNEIIELGPSKHNLFIAYRSRGYAKFCLIDYTGAEKDYLKAIELNEDDDLVWYNIGRARESKLSWAGAIKAYDRAIKLNPTRWEYFNSRAGVKQGNGDTVGASFDYREANKLREEEAKKAEEAKK